MEYQGHDLDIEINYLVEKLSNRIARCATCVCFIVCSNPPDSYSDQEKANTPM